MKIIFIVMKYKIISVYNIPISNIYIYIYINKLKKYIPIII